MKRIDENSETWAAVTEQINQQLAVSREFLEDPDFTEHDKLLIHKGRISAFKDLQSLPNYNGAVITTKE